MTSKFEIDISSDQNPGDFLYSMGLYYPVILNRDYKS